MPALRTKLIWGNVIASQLAIGLFVLLLNWLAPELYLKVAPELLAACFLLSGGLV